MSLPDAEERQHRNLEVHISEYNPIVSEEAEYINQKEDLVSLAPYEKDAVYRLLQKHGEGILGELDTYFTFSFVPTS